MPALSQTRFIITGSLQMRRGDRVVHFREELPEGATTLDPLPFPAPNEPMGGGEDGPSMGASAGPRNEWIITTAAATLPRGTIVKVTRSYTVEP